MSYDYMVEPRIQYATTKDGASIAYWTLGDEGPVLVVPPPAMPWSHIQLEWQVPEWRHWYEHLLETMRIVRYDPRGRGMSDRTPVEPGCDFTEEAVADLDAVVERLGLDTFALFGCYWAGPVAMRYAIRHPERVSHLMLWCAFSTLDEGRKNTALTLAMDALLESDYHNFTEVLAHTVFGWEEGEAARRLAHYFRESMSPEEMRQYWKSDETLDLTEELGGIAAPTLVMHRREFASLDVDVARRLAARIPNARLQLFEGKSLSPFLSDTSNIVDSMVEFMGLDTIERRVRHKHGEDSAPSSATPAGFRTIMFTDMAGSTEMTHRLGDDGAQTLVRRHNRIVGDALAAHGGVQIKHTGDGIMASFSTATRAVECAVAIQRAVEEHNELRPDEEFVVRVGLNAGEPVEEAGDLFGTAVQLASRVCAQAEPGEILTSDVIRQLVAGKGFLFADRGEAALRGFEDPVKVYEVRWRDS